MADSDLDTTSRDCLSCSHTDDISSVHCSEEIQEKSKDYAISEVRKVTGWRLK